MFCKKMFTKKFLVGAVCGAILSAAILIGCTGDTKPEGGRDIDRAEVTQVMPEREVRRRAWRRNRRYRGRW